MTAPALLDHGHEPSTLALAGDWHGETAFATQSIELARRGGADAIVHLGDFGLAYRDPGFRIEAYLAALDEALGPIPLYFIDGNHEPFPWLSSRPLDERGVRPVSARITHLPRGARWSWRGRKWLALGGAHSVNRLQLDRGPRDAPATNWWPEEALSDQDISRAMAGGHSDVLICHDAPRIAPVPHDYPPGSYPHEDELAADAHRDLVQAVASATRPRLIAHGHFHQRHRSILPGPEGTIEIIGLSHDGKALRDNLAWIDARTLHPIPPTAPFPDARELRAPSSGTTGRPGQ